MTTTEKLNNMAYKILTLNYTVPDDHTHCHGGYSHCYEASNFDGLVEIGAIVPHKLKNLIFLEELDDTLNTVIDCPAFATYLDFPISELGNLTEDEERLRKFNEKLCLEAKKRKLKKI